MKKTIIATLAFISALIFYRFFLDNYKCPDIWSEVVSKYTYDVEGGYYFFTGYGTSTEAIEHNKRVRECQTANGEF